MKDRNENRPGYKKTKVGWIPEEWRSEKLHSVSSIKTGPFGAQLHQRDYVKVGTPIVTVEHLGKTKIRHHNLPMVSIDDKKRLSKYILKKGDIIYSRVGSVDRNSLVSEREHGWLFSGRLLRIRPNDNKLLSTFLSYFLNQEHIKYFIRSIAVGGTMPSLNTQLLSGIYVSLPSYIEQKKIAEILSTWDTAIEQIRNLIDAKKRLKKALMQQLLTGKTKLKGLEEDNWEIVPFGKLVSPISRPVPKPNKTYLSIGLRSHCKGTFHKYIDEPEKIKMDTLYKVAPKDLIVNITFAWEGAIAFATESDSGGLISHRFPTFRVKGENAEIEFVRNLILTERFIWNLILISPGGAGRNRVMNKKDFLKIKVFIPSIKSQKKIGQILSTADNEINHLEKKLKAIEQQKRGLMHKLLTGEIRVKVNDKGGPAEDN